GNPLTLASQQGVPFGVTTDANSVYWAASQGVAVIPPTRGPCVADRLPSHVTQMARGRYEGMLCGMWGSLERESALLMSATLAGCSTMSAGAPAVGAGDGGA